MFFKEYNAKKIKEGDISKSREKFKNKKNKNLIFLLENRFFWMKEFIGNGKIRFVKKRNSKQLYYQ